MAVAIYQLNQSDKIPEKYYGMVSWSPVLAALLASGIIPSSNIRHQYPDPVGFVSQHRELDFLDYHTDLEPHRVRKYQYIIKQFRLNFGYDKHSIAPQEFQTWLENNPVPTLDNGGNPIKTIPSPSTESPQANCVRKKRSTKRQDDLIPIIEQCQKEVSDPDDYHKVWDKLVEKAKHAEPHSVLVEHIEDDRGGEIKYKQGKKSYGFLSKDALRKRIDPNARGKKKPKQAKELANQ